MSNWISLSPEALNQVTKQHVDGIEITVGMSPYDLPDGVRGRYRDEIDRFVIQFKYLGASTEKLRPVSIGDPSIVFMVGVHSGRLHEIHLDAANTRSVNFRVLEPQVADAIAALEKRIPGRTKNFEVARNVIAQKGDLLFQGQAR